MGTPFLMSEVVGRARHMVWRVVGDVAVAVVKTRVWMERREMESGTSWAS